MDEQSGSPELLMFLASTVHDMKNSIGVLSGTLEALLAAAPPSAPAELAQMLYQTRRLNDNLIQLLALYKDVGKPGYPFDPAPLPVSELVDQVAGQARVLLRSKGIALDTDFPPDLIWSMDEDLVIGVLVHAINNAIRYTRGRIALSAGVVDGMLELRVADDGAGFPPALLAAGAAALGPQRGAVDFLNNSSGLGLYFSAEVARMHRHRGRAGAIALDNGGPLGGGCFVLRLP